MNEIIYNLSLDCHRPGPQADIISKCGECSGRAVAVSLSSGGKTYEIDPDCTAVFRAKKPDGTLLYNACTVENNTVCYSVTSQTVAAEGTVYCELQILSPGGEILFSPEFTITVLPALYTDSAIESTDEFTELTEAITRVTTADAALSETSENPVQNKVVTAALSDLNKVYAGIYKKTVSGAYISAADALALAPFDLKIYGASTQAQTPSPQAHCALQNVSSPVTVKLSGKNILAYPYASSSTAGNNVTFTVNSNGTITASTTAAGASATTTLNLTNYTTPPVFPAGTYTISGCPAGGTLDKYYISVQSKVGTTYSTLVRDFGAGATFTLSTATALSISIPIKISTVLTTPITFSPLLRFSSETSAVYEQYSGFVYSVSLTDNQASPVTHELCRLTDGTNVWADYIEKQSGVWTLVKKTGKTVFSGTEAVTLPGTPAAGGYFRFGVTINALPPSGQLNASSGSKCTHFVQGNTITGTAFNFTGVGASTSEAMFCVQDTLLTANTAAGAQAFFTAQASAGTPVTLYYPLAAPVTYTLAASVQTALNQIVMKSGKCVIRAANLPYPSSIQVIYGCDTNIIINDLASRIAILEAL